MTLEYNVINLRMSWLASYCVLMEPGTLFPVAPPFVDGSGEHLFHMRGDYSLLTLYVLLYQPNLNGLYFWMPLISTWVPEPVQRMMNQGVKTNTRIHRVSVCLRSRYTEYATIKISPLYGDNARPNRGFTQELSAVKWVRGRKQSSWQRYKSRCVCLYTIGPRSLRALVEMFLCCFNDSVHLTWNW